MNARFSRGATISAALVVMASCGASDDTDDAPPARVRDDTVARSPDGVAGTRRASALGLTAVTFDGVVNPRGMPARYWFEYGPTSAYGSRTPERALPGRLGAHYRETFDVGTANWAAGGTGTELAHRTEGPVGFVRFTEPTGTDQNHTDGIGPNHLAAYLWMGSYDPGVATSARWGGGDPDLRGARVSVVLRGNDWQPRGSELVFWMQADLDLATQSDDNRALRTNWAHTGRVLTDELLRGGFQRAEYRLRNDPSEWSYAGNRLEAARDTYRYQALDTTLAHVNNDIFLMLVFVSLTTPPAGSIDIDELEIAYRNHSVLFPGNGAKIAAWPPGSSDPAPLVDGWRNGPGRSWTSAPNPSGPQEVVFDLAQPVTIERVQIHNDPDWPSKDVEIAVSADGATWTTLSRVVLPETAPGGPNFLFTIDDAARRRADAIEGRPSEPFPVLAATKVRVRVLSGYRPARWGLGEVEAFGRGAVETTEDEEHDVNEDVELPGVAAGSTVHYRLVAATSAGVSIGGDKEYVVPESRRPIAYTVAATRVRTDGARLEARVTPLGDSTLVRFEWGKSSDYGSTTAYFYAGTQLGPRTVSTVIDGLEPGTVYHYRVVAKNGAGAAVGEDRTFSTLNRAPRSFR